MLYWRYVLLTIFSYLLFQEREDRFLLSSLLCHNRRQSVWKGYYSGTWKTQQWQIVFNMSLLSNVLSEQSARKPWRKLHSVQNRRLHLSTWQVLEVRFLTVFVVWHNTFLILSGLAICVLKHPIIVVKRVHDLLKKR